MNIEHQKQIDKLHSEKAKLNEHFTKQLQIVLREKEELSLQLSSCEDKIQKMDLDRDAVKLRTKQMTSENQKNLKHIESQNETIQSLQTSLRQMEEQELKSQKQLRAKDDEMKAQLETDRKKFNSQI